MCISDYYIIINGITTDKKGNFIIDTLKRGEYVLGKYDYTAVNVTSHISYLTSHISIYPNPVSDICRIEFSIPFEKNVEILINDISGKTIYSTPVFSHQQFINWDTYGLSAGIYYVSIIAEGIIKTEKVVIGK